MKFFSTNLGIMKRINNILGTFVVTDDGLAVPSSGTSIQSAMADNIRESCKVLSGSVVKAGGVLVRPDGSCPTVTINSNTITVNNVFGVTKTGNIVCITELVNKTATFAITTPVYVAIKYAESATTEPGKLIDGSTTYPVISSQYASAQIITSTIYGDTMYGDNVLYLGYLSYSSGSWTYVPVVGSDLESRVSNLETSIPSTADLLESNAVVTGAASAYSNSNTNTGRITGSVRTMYSGISLFVQNLSGCTPNGGQVCIGSFGKPAVTYPASLSSTTHIAVKAEGLGYVCQASDFVQAATTVLIQTYLDTGDYLYLGSFNNSGTRTPPSYTV